MNGSHANARTSETPEHCRLLLYVALRRKGPPGSANYEGSGRFCKGFSDEGGLQSSSVHLQRRMICRPDPVVRY